MVVVHVVEVVAATFRDSKLGGGGGFGLGFRVEALGFCCLTALVGV